MQIVSASQVLDRHSLLQIRSGNANFECQPNAGQAQFTIDPQRECKFRVPAKFWTGTVCYRSAAGMQILNASQMLDRHSLL